VSYTGKDVYPTGWECGAKEETGRIAMNPNNEEITFQEKVELAIKYHLEDGQPKYKACQQSSINKRTLDK
jgi:hypothetical protein